MSASLNIDCNASGKFEISTSPSEKSDKYNCSSFSVKITLESVLMQFVRSFRKSFKIKGELGSPLVKPLYDAKQIKF